MRVHIKTTVNTELVPYNYQSVLVGVLHRWLGANEWHDGLSLYSLSWLNQAGSKERRGLHFPQGGHFFISSPEVEFVKQLVDGIRKNPEIAFGMMVRDLMLQPTPTFSEEQVFFAQSPILIKRSEEDHTQFYYPHDQESDELLTETLRRKLTRAGHSSPSVTIGFDRDYHAIKTKVSTYQGIKNKGTLCPVIVRGRPEEVAFAWEVGAGNSTGIGFGALT